MKSLELALNGAGIVMVSKKELEYQFERLQARKELALSEFRIRKKQRAYRDALLQELGLKTAESAAMEPETAGEGDADVGNSSDDGAQD